MKNLGVAALAAVVALISNDARAAYTHGMTGQLESVSTFTDSDAVYVRLKNQPTSHPGCTPGYFVIEANVPLERRKMLLARLLTAYASGETIFVGYDGNGSCADGYIRLHRVG